jgi:hypothetical protein
VAKVTVNPSEFNLVFFDAGQIGELIGTFAERIGLDADITINVDEKSALGRAEIGSLEPVVLEVQGGAFEDSKRPRNLSERAVIDVAGRLLFRVKDRLDPAFGNPPPEAELTLQQVTAWDAYCLGRTERAGYHPAKPRRVYHFRNRHGFTDVADAAFERLWSGEGLTWADIQAVCDETQAARQPA